MCDERQVVGVVWKESSMRMMLASALNCDTCASSLATTLDIIYTDD
jgi:hypothetical protein